ncbi:MAG: cytochrome c55X [Betaproteobacteria bacterium]|nr:cytochrome c55X [Betaproteobacteria bacterium]
MKLKFSLAIGCAVAMIGTSAAAQEEFAPEKIKQGAGMYSQHCAPCHGPRMADPEGAFDLRTFPTDQKNRFLNSVTKGKNSMPPWGGLFSADEIESLWAYVMAGEKKR